MGTAPPRVAGIAKDAAPCYLIRTLIARGCQILSTPMRTDRRNRMMLIAIGAVMMTALFIGPAGAVTTEKNINPQVRVWAPRFASRTAPGDTFKVRWEGPRVMFGPSAVRFHVLYREQNDGSFKPLPALGSEVTTATSARFAGEAGQVYIFKVSGEDANGHIGAAARARTIVPIDDGASRYAQYTGRWTAQSGDRFYRLGEHQSHESGAVFTYDFDGRRVWLIGAKGPDRGRARIFLDGRAYGTIDMYAPTARPRRVLWSSPTVKPISSIRQHRLKVVVAGTSGRPLVGIDALARLK